MKTLNLTDGATWSMSTCIKLKMCIRDRHGLRTFRPNEKLHREKFSQDEVTPRSLALRLGIGKMNLPQRLSLIHI